MIHIERPPAPAYFSSTAIQAAKADIEAQCQSVSQGRLKFNAAVLSPVKKDVMEAFNGKCAYCEAPLELGGFSHTDTFRPKNGSRGLKKTDFSELHYYWLAYEWDNLYASCSICNKNKYNVFPVAEGTERAPLGALGADLHHEESLLLDPCWDNPEEHLHFKADGQVIGLTERGELTIQILKLDRAGLVAERKRAADDIQRRLALGFDDTDEQVLFRDELFSGQTHTPYAAAQRTVYREWEQSLHSGSAIMPPPPPGNELSYRPGSDLYTSIRRPLEVRHFTIRRVELKNFRNIGYLDLQVLPPWPDQESWLLLLGDNGIGKSSILQAIALTLCGRAQIEALKVLPGDILRDGEADGFVKVYGDPTDEPVELLFNKSAFTKAAEEPLCFVLAYGATRLPPEGVLTGNAFETDYVNIGNLFYYTVALTDGNAWLSGLPASDFPRIASALYDLLDMQPGDKAVMEDGKLKLYFGDQGSFIGRSSDGYKSMVALACDIMRTLSLENASYHSTGGIVLIDEMGNHLHPRWRMKVVAALRNAFPLLQFVVSTHEALCLRGLMQGEVIVLVRDREDEVRALDQTVLPDHTALRVDQLLTSDFFGLLNTLDPETEKRYEDYYALLAKPEADRLPGDSERIAALSKELAGKDMLGSTPQMQALYRVVNETYAKNLRADEYKTKTTLKEETVSEVKDWLTKSKPNWL